MEVTTDKVFAQAVLTIKSLTDLSKSSSLPRPSINDRLTLYGLYNQATRGDPNSNELNLTNNNPTELKKYNSWLKFKGLSKSQARKQYIKYLLEILQNNYSSKEFPAIIPLRNNLQESWDKLENLNLSLNINSIQLPISPPSTLSSSNSKFHNVNTSSNIDSFLSSTLVSPLTKNMPSRSHSPAASLYRIASSGISPNMIRPPSRNQSFSKSRHGSFSGSSNINNNISNNNSNNNGGNSTIQALQQQTIQPLVQPYNNQSLEFLKWQGEINSTLLKISTELSSIKMQQNNLHQNHDLSLNDAGHRSISGSTTFSTQSELHDYKLRHNNNHINSNYNFSDRISSLRNYNFISPYEYQKDLLNKTFENDSPEKKNLSNWVYTKLKILIKYLKRKFQIKIKLGSYANKIVTTILAFVFLGLFKRIVDIYLKQSFLIDLDTVSQGKSLIQYMSQWILKTIRGRRLKYNSSPTSTV